MPRLTYSPSASSRAARAAISSRVSAMSALPGSGRGGVLAGPDGPALDPLLDEGDLDDALHEDARRVHVLRLDLAHIHELLHLRDRHPTGSCAQGVEVSGALAKHQVSVPVALPGVHEGEVGDDRLLQDVGATVVLALRERPGL